MRMSSIVGVACPSASSLGPPERGVRSRSQCAASSNGHIGHDTTLPKSASTTVTMRKSARRVHFFTKKVKLCVRVT